MISTDIRKSKYKIIDFTPQSQLHLNNPTEINIIFSVNTFLFLFLNSHLFQFKTPN